MFKALLVYPSFPVSYWSEKYALAFVKKKAAMPPLGLLTIAAMFPQNFSLRIVDENIRQVEDREIEWADFVFISAMIAQRDSFSKLVAKCNKIGVPVICGGPYPTSFSDEIQGVQHIVKGEVEDFFSLFLNELVKGEAPEICDVEHYLGHKCRPDICRTPVPRYDLVNLKHYGSVALQFSRGCPFNCEFCDITQLFGHNPRTKPPDQMLRELEILYDSGWRGSIFLVDDNFIGNIRNVKIFLPELIDWQNGRKHPFSFYTEASINLADDKELLEMMKAADFSMVFIGLETPDPVVLAKTNKFQNLKTKDPEYLLNAVRKIQQNGMEVTAGFILGLDGEKESCFESQIAFIQKAGIPTAMVGLLTAIKGTELYRRLRKEGRLLAESTGNNVSATLNYIPEISAEVLITGYKRVLATLYEHDLRNYFQRCYSLIQNWEPANYARRPINLNQIIAIFTSLRKQLLSAQGVNYFKFLSKVLIRYPSMFNEAVRLAVMGYHYEKVTSQQMLLAEFTESIDIQLSEFKMYCSQLIVKEKKNLRYARKNMKIRIHRIKKEYNRIHKDFRVNVKEAFEDYKQALEDCLLERISCLNK